jgi:hypothetical protein
VLTLIRRTGEAVNIYSPSGLVRLHVRGRSLTGAAIEVEVPSAWRQPAYPPDFAFGAWIHISTPSGPVNVRVGPGGGEDRVRLLFEAPPEWRIERAQEDGPPGRQRRSAS